VKVNVGHSLRLAWWRKFHPLVRVGWYVASAGSTRPSGQTAVGVGMMAAGLMIRRSQKSRNRLIYKQTVSPGETTRIRVYRGTSAPSEVTVRT
jgi:hypothetical protein